MKKQIAIEPNAPYLKTSRKRFNKPIPPIRRDTAWRKNRKQNKQYLREAFYSENQI